MHSIAMNPISLAYRFFVIREDQAIVNNEELEYMREHRVQDWLTHVPEHTESQIRLLSVVSCKLVRRG